MPFNFCFYTFAIVHIILIVYVNAIFTLSTWTILCDIFCLCILCLFMWSLIINVHNNNNKKPKNFCVDCWFDLGQMDLESRQHSYAKGLGQCQLIKKPSACNLKLHLIHHSRSSKFICNMIIV